MTNWERFTELLRSTNREGVESLIDYLDTQTDFKTAPASTKYHGAKEGGLLEHSLLVYNTMDNIIRSIGADIPDDSIKICALLHDISKVNLYEKTSFNKKVYKPNGTKHDELGNFDWETTIGYKTVDYENKFIYSNHEATSEFIVRQFIPIHIEESVAILHHHFAMGYDSIADKGLVSDVYKRYPIAVFLHVADTIAAFYNQI